MAINKVVFGNTTLIDLTSDTVDSTALLSGFIAHGSNGEIITGTIESKIAETYTPGTADLSIASGYYLSGVQTITGDSNLVSANIASGVSIFGIIGTHEGGSYEPMTAQEIYNAAESGWIGA